MSEPKTATLTVEEIHRIREQNYELTKNMKPEERRAYYREKSDAVQARIEQLRANRGEPTRNCVRV